MSVDISDHALVRYLERVKGMNLDKYRDEIRALVSEHWKRQIPDSGYDDGLLFVIEHLESRPTIVTILSPAMRPKRKAPWSTRTLVHMPMPKCKTDQELADHVAAIREELGEDNGRRVE
jgi:hypothetical protein